MDTKKCWRIFSVMQIVVLSSGCAGTLHSRFDRTESASVRCVGKWPYQAVATDVVAVKNKRSLASVAAVSLPVDFVIDIQSAFPLILCFGILGYKRTQI
jgi:hypothetical protein